MCTTIIILKMESVNYIIAGSFIVVAFLVNKFPKLLSGYDSIPDENKPAAKRLSVNMLLIIGIGVLVLGLVVSLAGLSGIWSGAPILFILLVTVVYLVKYVKLGPYENNSGKASIVIMVLIVCAVIVSTLIGVREPEITISDQQMHISGIYGNDYNLTDIEYVTLKDETPVTTFKSNGFGMGGIKKGHFDVKGDGICLLFVSGNGKCIRLKTKSDVIYINFDDETATVDLFNKLEKVINSD